MPRWVRPWTLTFAESGRRPASCRCRFIAARKRHSSRTVASNGRQFGIFVDQAGNLYDNDGGGLYTLEDTGLNRSLGNVNADDLYGGTGLDFLYGRGGNDTLYRQDGRTFESLDGGLAGDQWKEYAKESDQVWYVGASNADDIITVDYVTEPGLLQNHHLITRLTNNNGNFSFAAKVRLDFNATNQTIAYYCDADGPLGGGTWSLLGTTNITAGTGGP